MKLVTLVILTFLLACYSNHLQCTKGLVHFYSYESEITGTKGKKHMHLKALVTTSCHGTKKFEGKEVMIMVMVTTNVQIYHEGNHTLQVPYDKSFEKPLTYLQDRKGEILSVIHDKDEKPSVISIKKSILSNFVVKLAGESSEEETQAGKVRFIYEKAILKSGKHIIRKRAVQVLQQPDPSMKRKDQKYRQVSFIQLHKDGKIHKVYTEQGSSIGKSSKRAEINYQNKKNKIGHIAHPDDYQDKAGDAFEFGAKSTLYLVKSGKLEGSKIKLKKKPKKKGGTKTLTLEDYQNEFDDSQKVTNLSLDPALIQEAFETKKQNLVKEVHFPSLLQKIREEPNNHNLLAKAHSYVSTLQDEALDHVIEEYSKLPVEQELNYALSLISLFTVAQTEKGQEQLIKAMENKLTAQQAIVNSLAIKNPSEKLINTLQSFSGEKFHDLDETEKHFINTNAYLAYVHTASKSNGERSHQILSEISENIEKAQTLREFEKEIHALSNAGDIVPLEAITVIAVNENLPLELRIAAIKGLGFRTSLETNEKVTNLLQHLTEKTYNEAIRTAAVNALTQREAEIQDASSLEFLTQYLEDINTPSTLVHAIKEYNLEVDSEHSHGILEDTKLGPDHHIGERSEAIKVMELEGYFEETEDDVNLLEAGTLWGRIIRRMRRRRVARRARMRRNTQKRFKRVRAAFRRAGNKIKRFVKKVGSEIKTVAQKVGKAIVRVAKLVYQKTIGAVIAKVKGFINGIKEKFSAASFKGEKICVQSNSNGDRLCMYDQDMIGFIRKQGDLTIIKWSKQFSFEKLIGVQIMNLYVGMVGYAGTRIDCATNSFDVVIFGRGAAKAKLFGRRVPIIAVEIELQKRTYDKLVDRAYVSVYKAVIFNHQFVPEKIRRLINYCQKKTRPLIKPVKKPLLNFSFTIVVVIVPLTFSISVTAEMGVDLVFIICPSRLTLTASVQPYIGVGINVQAGIGFAVISGGVQASFEANYRLKPSFGTSNCNLCALLKQEVKPITIAISLYLKAAFKTWSVQLYQFNGPVIKGTLFRLCLFNDKPYNPESVLNGPAPDSSNPFSRLRSNKKSKYHNRSRHYNKPRHYKPNKKSKYYNKPKHYNKPRHYKPRHYNKPIYHKPRHYNQSRHPNKPRYRNKARSPNKARRSFKPRHSNKLKRSNKPRNSHKSRHSKKSRHSHKKRNSNSSNDQGNSNDSNDQGNSNDSNDQGNSNDASYSNDQGNSNPPNDSNDQGNSNTPNDSNDQGNTTPPSYSNDPNSSSYSNDQGNSNNPNDSNDQGNTTPPSYSNDQENSKSPSYSNYQTNSNHPFASPIIRQTPQKFLFNPSSSYANEKISQTPLFGEQSSLQPIQYSIPMSNSQSKFIYMNQQRKIQPQNNYRKIQSELLRIENLVKNLPIQKVQQRIIIPKLPIRSLERSMRRNSKRNRRVIRRSEDRIEKMLEKNRLSSLLKNKKRRTSSLIRRSNRKLMNEFRRYEIDE